MVEKPVATLHGARVLWTALFLGPVLFAAVIQFALDGGRGFADQRLPVFDVLSTVAVIWGFLQIPLAVFLRRRQLRLAAAGPVDQRPQRTVGAMLIAMAMLEGVVLFNLLCWLLTGDPMPNLAGAGILMLAQIALFPRVEHFAEAGVGSD